MKVSENPDSLTNSEDNAVSKPHDWEKAAPYALLSIFMLFCAVGLLLFFVIKSRELVALGLVGNVYYVVLVPLGISVAICVFGVLRSYAVFQGEVLGGTLKLGGAIVVLALVVIGGFVLPTPASNFTLTVFVHGLGAGSDRLLQGEGHVWLDIGGSRRTADIDSNGVATFSEVPANFRGQDVSVDLDADGYEVVNPNQKITLNATSASLEVRKKAGHITGYVKDDAGARLSGVTIIVAGITQLTKEGGRFDISIPGEKLQAELTLQAEAVGFASWNDSVVPNANDVVITLVQKK